jgi:cholesterol transport system auxiliary component
VKRLTPWLPLAAICLAACTGSLFKSKAAPPTVYLLTALPAAPAGAAPSADMALDLAVLKPRIRPGLETDRIAVLYPDRRLDYFADARWSGPLAEVLQDLAVQEFHAHGHLRTVSGDSSVFASAYWLEIEVTDFQAQYAAGASAPSVRVHLLARIGSSDERRIIGQFAADAERPAAENRLTSIVAAYAQAADAAMTELVAHADDALAKMSEAR